MVITISICVKKYPKKFLSQLLLLFTRLVSSDFEIIVWIFRWDSSTRISETMQSTMFYWKASCWKPTWSHQAQNVQIKLMQRLLQNTLLNVWDELSRQAMFWIFFSSLGYQDSYPSDTVQNALKQCLESFSFLVVKPKWVSSKPYYMLDIICSYFD